MRAWKSSKSSTPRSPASSRDWPIVEAEQQSFYEIGAGLVAGRRALSPHVDLEAPSDLPALFLGDRDRPSRLGEATWSSTSTSAVVRQLAGSSVLHSRVVSVTVELPDEVLERLEAEAAARGVSVEELVAEALAERFGPERRRLSFAAAGRSTTGRRAAEAEELLAEGFATDSADRLSRALVLVVETGPLLAVADEADPDHFRCRALLGLYLGHWSPPPLSSPKPAG